MAQREKNVNIRGMDGGKNSHVAPTLGLIEEEGLTEDTISANDIIAQLNDIVMMGSSFHGQ